MDIVYHDLQRMHEVKQFVEEWNNGNSFIEVQTSGTTGAPKCMQLSKSLMKKSAQQTISFFELEAGMKAGLCLSMQSIAGKMMMVRAFLCEMELHVLPVDKNPLFKVDFELDFNAMVPVQALSVAEAGREIHRKGKLLIGGSPLTDNQFRSISEYYHDAYQTYGMTETASHIALRRINGDSNSSYRVLGCYSVSEREGCLVVHHKDLPDGAVVTKDCVELVNDKEFKYLGRTDFVIVSGGHKIHPETLEVKLGSMFKSPCMVAPISDDTWGELVGLVLHKDETPPTMEMLKTTILPFELPRKFTFIDEIKRNQAGKIDRKLMLEILTHHEWETIL